MNTQFQRMMAVLFLALTIIAVTVLFWLPTDNSSSRILVANENASTNLLNLLDPESAAMPADTTALAAENTGAEVPNTLGQNLTLDQNLPQEQTSNQAAQNELLADEGRLRQMAESQQHSAMNTGSQNAQNEQGDYGKLASVPGIPDANTSANISAQNLTENANYGVDVNANHGVDVMGNFRNHISDYQVRQNDWFSTITGKHWEDLFMWPDLYTMNMDNLRSANPDMIFPGEKVSIYESLVADGEFSETDRETLIQAYLKVYQVYKQAGESKALAAAQLLASAVRYKKDFLEKYSRFLDPMDKQMAEKLIKEQAFLD